ncbi:MAG: hypothetical protein KC495_06640 [Dehalococcoidia bacterium]|nr:hypothetical protein [Dehalococcoidia bacterium]
MVRMRPLLVGAALAALATGTLASGTVFAKTGAAPAETLIVRTDLPNQKFMPALLPNSKENTSVIAQNNGTAAATIAMDVYTPAGVLIPEASRVETGVPVGGTRTFAQALNTGLSPGFRGVGVLSSDQSINALLVRDIEQNGTGRKSYSVHNSFGSGGNTVTLPFIANNAGGVFQTRFAIANTGSAIACVTIQYAFDPILSGGGSYNDAPSGQAGCTTGYGVPVGGQITFGPNSVPAEATQAMPGATAGKLMSATVTSTGAPVTVAVDAYVSDGKAKLGSYDGFLYSGPGAAGDDLGTTVIIPIALKLGGYYSQILLSNPNAQSATCSILYKSDAGATYTVPLTIPANGTSNHSVYAPDSPIPEGFLGAATVTCDRDVAAVLFRIKMTAPGSFLDEDLYTAVSGVPVDRASTTAKVPLIFRRIGQGGGFDGYNTWVSVATVDGGSATVNLNTVTDTTSTPGSCGAAATYTTSKTITGSFVFYQNANSDNGLGANPACLWGGMTITSDKPIIAIAVSTNDIFPGDNDGLFNAFPG